MDKGLNISNKSSTIEAEKFRETLKFNRWVNLFLDKENSQGLNTLGNQTQSAIHAYKLDPKNQYHSAGVIGHENFKKLKTLASSYLSKQGITFGSLIDHAIEKMKKSDSPLWWDRVTKMVGLDVIVDQIQINNTVNNQVSSIQEYSQEERNDFNKKFCEFLESRYSNN